jgi:hypothetical protein
MFEYFTCCVSSTAELINAMTEKGRQITANTFFKYVSLKEVNEQFGYNLNSKQLNSIKKDYHVAYFKSKYDDQECYYLVHSAIEYIFV